MAQEFCLAGADFEPLGAFKQLHQRLVSVDLQHLAPARLAVLLLDFHQLVICYAAHAFHQHQRTDNLFYCTVFFQHDRPSLRQQLFQLCIQLPGNFLIPRLHILFLDVFRAANGLPNGQLGDI